MKPLRRPSAPGGRDRILSMIAWVLVTVGASCGSIFLFSQILTHPERPVRALASIGETEAAEGPGTRPPESVTIAIPPAASRASLPRVKGKPLAAVKPAAAPKIERTTLKMGSFAGAFEAVQFGKKLGIDGHTFTPVLDPASGRYSLHFGEFHTWKDAIQAMEAIRAKKLRVDVVVWPIPTRSGRAPAPTFPS